MNLSAAALSPNPSTSAQAPELIAGNKKYETGSGQLISNLGHNKTVMERWMKIPAETREILITALNLSQEYDGPIKVDTNLTDKIMRVLSILGDSPINISGFILIT